MKLINFKMNTTTSIIIIYITTTNIIYVFILLWTLVYNVRGPQTL